MKNLQLIGTNHISKDSVMQVVSQITTQKPEIVAVELDPSRAYSLKHKQKRPKNMDLLKTLGLNGFLFYVIGEFLQNKLGKIVDLDPGSEMLAAMDAAKEAESELRFIDRDIRITLQRLRYLKKREFARMFYDLIADNFKPKQKVDISKVPDEKFIESIIDETKRRYPSLHRILIDERDRFMARKLTELMAEFPDKRIIAVVGAGHIRGITNYIKNPE